MANSENSAFSFLNRFTYVDDDASRYEVTIAQEGFSYLDMLSEKSARTLSFAEKQQRDTSAALDGSTGAGGKLNVKKHERINHDDFCADTSLDAILRDIQQRREKFRFFPIAAVLGGIILVTWLSMPLLFSAGGLAMLVFFWVPPAIAILLWNVWKLDISRRHVQFQYRFTEAGQAAFDNINSALNAISKSGQNLVFTGRRHFDDTRYSGGAKDLPEFDRIDWNWTQPPLLDLDFKVWQLKLLNRELFFMPDHILVFAGSETGAVPYSSFSVECDSEDTQARDKIRVTKDTKVVGSTWRFVNEDGTPDKRFNANVKVPIITMGVAKFDVGNFKFDLYISDRSVSDRTPEMFHSLKESSKNPQKKIAEERRRKTSNIQQKSPEENGKIYETLLNATCLIMVADGKVRTDEKAQIQEIMEQANAPWPQEEVLFHIDRFVAKVREQGLSEIIRSTQQDVKIFRDPLKYAQLRKCLKLVMLADGKISDRERKIAESLLRAAKPG